MRALAFALSCTVALAAAASPFVNTNVERTVDASGFAVVESIKLKIRSESGAVSKYHVAVPPQRSTNLAHIRAEAGGKPLVVSRDGVHENGSPLFLVRLARAVDQGSEASLTVTLVYTGLYEAFPAEIKQSESQLVRWSDSHYFWSPYTTNSQKLTVKLESTRVESFTPKKPSSHRGNRLVFGSYDAPVDAFSHSALSIHAENNAPFVELTTVEREVEVSLWGNVAVEEVYDMLHAGAKLKGGFSRLDYQMQRMARGPHFRQVLAKLPASATDVYYRDIIGNVTTSHMREAADAIDLEIQPRFPMFGGWRTTFYIGYNAPIGQFLRARADGKLVLSVSATPSLTNAVTKDLNMKIVLPEGATDIEVETPFDVQQSRSQRYTYLDSAVGGGRPVLVLRSSNVVDDHRGDVVVTFRSGGLGVWLEPALLVGSIFSVFLLAIFAARLRLSIAPKSKAA